MDRAQYLILISVCVISVALLLDSISEHWSSAFKIKWGNDARTDKKEKEK